ncbi:MAG: DUF2905 domain-containing protein [Spirochaetia bacterium]|nr:DUF2905 domain-containing protein [Spirochaetia bacterium]
MPSEDIAKLFIVAGVVLIILGAGFFLFPRLPFLGNLPGDIHIKKDNFSFHFPVVTSILLSVLFTLFLWLFQWMKNR